MAVSIRSQGRINGNVINVAAEINANGKSAGSSAQEQQVNNRLASCRRVIPLLETACCHNPDTVMTSFISYKAEDVRN